jgi:hypothetical protein
MDRILSDLPTELAPSFAEARRSDSFDAGRMAERRVGAGAQKLRQLIAEAERAARFLDDVAKAPGPNSEARYRARELRSEIAAARAET